MATRRKACDLCCQKKIRCNGSKPRCSHCEIYDAKCTYNGTPRRATRRSSQLSECVATLDARVERVELLLETLLSRIPPNVGPARCLPPDTVAIVQEYFSTQPLPLFDQTTFTDMLHSDEPSSWAVINVVLALGLKDSHRVANHVKNAQSALTDLLTKDADILCLQVVLGLCMVFQESPNLQAASILLATAVTLVHRLGLHASHSEHGLNGVTIFWITYILDKSIHLRAQQPPLLLNAIELPASGAFRARAELAVIQSRVYDALVYSRDIQPVEEALRKWHSNIPSDAHLHWSHLYTLAMIYRAHSHNYQWLHSVLECGNTNGTLRPLPGSWTKMVASARECIQFHDMPTWSTICGRVTALLLLLSNNEAQDKTLIESALQSLSPAAAQNQQLQQLHRACQELVTHRWDTVFSMV
ncbi:hypothetical protein GE09DRAFT_572215 [Coniochaeta sp. 2T2.1]|nr:hypothetical protein GE09DRAFT_572215 [Coniochaeta sp. 2T2.1]